jgi:hypothetical protein
VAELVCVYDLKPVPRTVEDVLPTPTPDDDHDEVADRADRDRRARAPKAAGKWLTASVTDDIPAVIAVGFDVATRRDPDHDRDWVALVVVNCAQIDAITDQAAPRGSRWPSSSTGYTWPGTCGTQPRRSSPLQFHQRASYNSTHSSAKALVRQFNHKVRSRRAETRGWLGSGA